MYLWKENIFISQKKRIYNFTASCHFYRLLIVNVNSLDPEQESQS